MSKENEKKKSNKKNSTNKKDNSKKDNLKEVTNSKETKATKEERIIEAEFDYNEDLDEVVEDEFDDEEEVVVETEEETKSEEETVEEETVRIEEVPSKKNIEKIEKMAKEKKKEIKKEKKKKTNSKFNHFMLFFERNHTTIYGFIGGALLATLIAFIIWPERIATLKDGEQSIVKVGGKNYTASELYENMKDYYSVSLLLDDIDNDLLTKKYPEDKELLEKVNDNANYYYNMYQQYYNYTKEQFLEQNGFSSHEAFVEYLKLDYRRNKYMEEYIESNLTDEDIKDYYDENVFGDINTQHILVEVSDTEGEGLSDKDAKKLAEKIITKLNDGTSWEDVQKKYKDQITFEDLGYQSWNASLEDSFMDALEDMDDNSYSEEPVKTSYGYHVIYRLDQKKAPKLKEAKEEIVEILIADAQKEDSNILYKSLIALREEKNIKFNDTVMKDKYKEYCKQYEKKKK